MRQIIVLIVTLLATGEVREIPRDARVDSLYREALAQVGQVPPKVSINAFEQVLKLDWKFAPGHYQIAKLYINMNTPLTRQSARKALNEAMRLDPENADYQFTLGSCSTGRGSGGMRCVTSKNWCRRSRRMRRRRIGRGISQCRNIFVI